MFDNLFNSFKTFVSDKDANALNALNTLSNIQQDIQNNENWQGLIENMNLYLEEQIFLREFGNSCAGFSKDRLIETAKNPKYARYVEIELEAREIRKAFRSTYERYDGVPMRYTDYDSRDKMKDYNPKTYELKTYYHRLFESLAGCDEHQRSLFDIKKIMDMQDCIYCSEELEEEKTFRHKMCVDYLTNKFDQHIKNALLSLRGPKKWLLILFNQYPIIKEFAKDNNINISYVFDTLGLYYAKIKVGFNWFEMNIMDCSLYCAFLMETENCHPGYVLKVYREHLQKIILPYKNRQDVYEQDAFTALIQNYKQEIRIVLEDVCNEVGLRSRPGSSCCPAYDKMKDQLKKTVESPELRKTLQLD